MRNGERRVVGSDSRRVNVVAPTDGSFCLSCSLTQSLIRRPDGGNKSDKKRRSSSQERRKL